ncbi:hypothetical protein KAFR_0E03040 [Kazachstania africana CBS 2517]|uniref:inositol phosphorylceramide mannosyltransferase n=1 Tax=Kazachstania africana (strain ATCC 22294 / BCRC 22015 / CBS 2517 / CECT 1963 / NBRC 1671 / NRRL Y-8276) TaxID=1071382 RepID=H2AVQ6_KAZAF|nr:hypothetical protein KAFR_0E03040 [Kazachstania africana CBS 2517]CCF58456.1 hypothetical protein KAFR_0E03040 [Kazachstania africana CBS 2517]
MRKELQILIYSNVLLLSLIVFYTFDLLTLCIDDTSEDAFLDSDLNPHTISDSSYLNTTNKPQLIPKIIHQTYKTTDIPEQWKESQKKCIELHSDYEYILWTDEMAYQFIREEYPWFLSTFENYNFPIQRADAIRYFVLAHFGGVYIDLDDGCERKLDRLLTVPAFVRKTSPTGISNDVMGSVPRHPFFLRLLKSLKHYDKNWYVPYLTIMGSTGPLFVSVVWKQYKRWYNNGNENGAVKILQPADYKMHKDSFFSIAKGSSWHLDDAKFMKTLGNHILSCVVAGFIFGFFILFAEYCFYCWLCDTRAVGNANGGSTNVTNWKLLWRQFSNKMLLVLDKIFSIRKHDNTNDTGVIFDGNVNFENSYGKNARQKRSRKDSNSPYHNIMTDLEKNDPQFTDLS